MKMSGQLNRRNAIYGWVLNGVERGLKLVYSGNFLKETILAMLRALLITNCPKGWTACFFCTSYFGLRGKIAHGLLDWN